MKSLINAIFLFFSLSFYCQNDTISVVKTSNISEVFIESNQTIYRGIKNRIFINVPNPQTLIASSQGLFIEDNKYYISPGAGNEQKIFLRFKLNDGTFVNEEHILKIKSIPIALGLINGYNCSKCLVEMKKSELKDAIVSLKFEDVSKDFNFKVNGFSILFSNQKVKWLDIKGDRINEEAFEKINKLEVGSKFYIMSIKYSYSWDGLICKTTPIKIIIIDEE